MTPAVPVGASLACRPLGLGPATWCHMISPKLPRIHLSTDRSEHWCRVLLGPWDKHPVALKLPSTLPLMSQVLVSSGFLVGDCSVGKEECHLEGIVGPQSCCNVGAVGVPSPRNCNLGIGDYGHHWRVFSVKPSSSGKGECRQAPRCGHWRP